MDKVYVQFNDCQSSFSGRFCSSLPSKGDYVKIGDKMYKVLFVSWKENPVQGDVMCPTVYCEQTTLKSFDIFAPLPADRG